MEKSEELKEAAKPLLKLLAEKYHPHVTVVVTPTSAELFEGVTGVHGIMDYIKD